MTTTAEAAVQHAVDASTPRHSALDIARALGMPPPTPEQAAVIEAGPRPLLVVAGAGSGKTETMAARVVWLVANGLVDPDQVLGLTFTRKAAAELSQRIAKRLRGLERAGIWTPPADDGIAATDGPVPVRQARRPVGTVHIGVSTPLGTRVASLVIAGDRDRVRR